METFLKAGQPLPLIPHFLRNIYRMLQFSFKPDFEIILVFLGLASFSSVVSILYVYWDMLPSLAISLIVLVYHSCPPLWQTTPEELSLRAQRYLKKNGIYSESQKWPSTTDCRCISCRHRGRDRGLHRRHVIFKFRESIHAVAQETFLCKNQSIRVYIAGEEAGRPSRNSSGRPTNLSKVGSRWGLENVVPIHPDRPEVFQCQEPGLISPEEAAELTKADNVIYFTEFPSYTTRKMRAIRTWYLRNVFNPPWQSFTAVIHAILDRFCPSSMAKMAYGLPLGLLRAVCPQLGMLFCYSSLLATVLRIASERPGEFLASAAFEWIILLRLWEFAFALWKEN